MISDSILGGFPFFTTIFISEGLSMDWPMGTLLLQTGTILFYPCFRKALAICFHLGLLLEKPRTLLHLDLLPPWAGGIVGLAHREFFLECLCREVTLNPRWVNPRR